MHEWINFPHSPSLILPPLQRSFPSPCQPNYISFCFLVAGSYHLWSIVSAMLPVWTMGLYLCLFNSDTIQPQGFCTSSSHWLTGSALMWLSLSFKYLLKCHLCREAFSDSLPSHSKNIFSTCFISLLCTYFHPTCYIFCQPIWFIVSPHTRMSAFPTQGIWSESLSYPQHTQQHLVQSKGSINISPKNEWVRIKEDSFNFLHLFFLFLSFLFVAKSEQAPGFLPQAASLYNQELRSARSCQHCFKRLYLAFPASHFSCMSSPEELWKLGLASTGREDCWHQARWPWRLMGHWWVVVNWQPWPPDQPVADISLRAPTSRDGRRVLSCKSQRYEKLRVGGEKRFLEVRSKLCHLLAVCSWVPPGIPRILWIQATNTASSTQNSLCFWNVQQTSAKARTPNSAHGPGRSTHTLPRDLPNNSGKASASQRALSATGPVLKSRGV